MAVACLSLKGKSTVSCSEAVDARLLRLRKVGLSLEVALLADLVGQKYPSVKLEVELLEVVVVVVVVELPVDTM